MTPTQRSYPQTELPGPAQGFYPAAQVLGYVGTINSTELGSRASQGYQAGDAFGQSGLEYQYETELRGVPGSQQLEVDPQGVVAGVLKSTKSIPGDDIVTNLDTNLQQVADNALATQIQSLRNTFDPACNGNTGCYPQPTGGAVVVMSPQTGAVYAMSSYPSYNPSVWVGGITQSEYNSLSDPANNEPLLNRAIDGLYIPGSTFKLNTATAALQTGLISPDFTYYDSGTFTTPDCQYGSTTCTFHNSAGDPTGDRDVSSALTVSSDDFFYNLGYLFYSQQAKYGPTPIQDQAAQYSLGELTGIDLPGEAEGRVDSQAERVKLHAEAPVAFPHTTWYTGDNIEMAFGQGAHVHHPDRTGRGLLDLRQRGHPVRPRGGRRRGEPLRPGGQADRPPGHRPRDPAPVDLPGPAGRVHRGGPEPGRAPPTARSRGSTSPAGSPARPARPTPSPARSRPPGSSGSVRRRIRSTWWSASSTRPGTAPRRPPRWSGTSSTTWPPTRSGRWPCRRLRRRCGAPSR